MIYIYFLFPSCEQLKKIGKRYKNQSEKLQQLLTENNISHQHITNPSNAPPQPIESDEKKQLQEQINEKIKTIDQITANLTSLQAMLETEKQAKSESDTKFNTLQQQYNEAEKQITDLTSKNEQIATQLNDEKVCFFILLNFSLVLK